MYGNRRRRLIIAATAVGVVVVAAIAIAIASSGSDSKETSARSSGAGDRARTLTIAVAGDPETLDSDQSHFQLSNEVNLNTQDAFFRYGTKPHGDFARYVVDDIQGSSIESWKYSADRKTLDLTVRDGMKFAHTGNPVTADDFIYWFKRAFGTKAGYLFQTNTAEITKFEKTGPMTFRLHFRRPNPFFLPLFRDQSTAPVDSKQMGQEATKKDPWAKTWKARHDAASGAYMVESAKPGVQMVLVANPTWHGKQPFFKRVVLKIVPSAATRALLLRRGSVDVAETLGVDDLDALRTTDGVKVLTIPDRNQYHLGLNAKQAPFDKLQVRQALSYAVPYDAIAKDVLHGQAATSQSPIARAGAFFDGDQWPYKTDLAKAKSLLKEAGVGGGFKFELKIATDDPAIEDMAVVLKDSFKQIGVDMAIDKQTPAVFAEGLNTNKDQAWLRSLLWYLDDPGYVGHAFYACDSLLNWMHYCNEKVDAAVDEMIGLPASDKARKQQLATQMQKMIVDDAPTLMLGEPRFQIAMRDDIKGYVSLPDDLMDYTALSRSPND